MMVPVQPFDPTWQVSQFFGVNRRFYRRHFDLPGHNGFDLIGEGAKRNGFGTEILAAHDGTVERIEADVPHTTKGNGVVISHEGFSTYYWHLASITVKVGEAVSAGDTIGTMGNTGLVRPKPSETCPHCGTHLHFGKRVHGASNAYEGFVDPLPDLYQDGWQFNVRFTRNLSVGTRGDDVSWLQTFLAIEGFGRDYQPIGVFGPKTVRDVKKLQDKHDIRPALGYVGPKTRSYLNGQYTIY